MTLLPWPKCSYLLTLFFTALYKYDDFRADLYSTLACDLLLWFYHNILCGLLQIYGYFYRHYLLVLCICVEYGGHGVLLQVGLFDSFTLFLVTILLHQKKGTNLNLVIDTSFSFLLVAAFVDSPRFHIQFGSLLRSSFVVYSIRPLLSVLARRDSSEQCRLRSILEQALYQFRVVMLFTDPV
jgi:hypothetical protein